MKKICGLVVFAGVVVVIAYLLNRTPLVTMTQSDSFEQCADVFEDNLVSNLNSDQVIITIAGTEVTEFGYDFYVSSEMKLMVEGDFLRSLVSCSVLAYPNGKVIIAKGENKLELALDSTKAIVNDQEIVDMKSKVYRDENNGKLFIPIDDIAGYLSYTVSYDFSQGWIDMTRLPGEVLLPAAYDMRNYGRVTDVRDQGKYGTCWAFASLGAFETTLMPGENIVFSTDHMALSNSYNLDLDSGGEHTMSIAYLAAWQGPVYEKDDPYGDGVTDGDLKAVKHLEEALVINEKDFDIIKSAIFRYGAIETSLYSQLDYADSHSQYYSEANAAYYYDGTETPNHDVVVVGWDDNYPKENFTIQPEGDGAFICKNSWGENFGENGYFYVSYYDSNLCSKSVVYTRIGNADNYDKIYQSDLLGWVGLMGFGREEAYFANVYRAGSGEELSAVAFYATDENTEFEVYVVRNFENANSLKTREFVVSGSMKYAGYYTVDFPEAIPLDANEKFAVVVKIKTPGVIHPIAIEYDVDARTETFDISDGEGYISLYGELWHSAEATQNCNVCLKAFTRNVDRDNNGTTNSGGISSISTETPGTTTTDPGTNEPQQPEILTEGEEEE